MYCRTEELSFLRRNGSIRHVGKPFLQCLIYRLHPVMKIAYERLRLKNTVDESIAVTIAERTDTRIQYAVYRTKVHRYNLSFVLIQLAKCSCRKTNFSAVLYQRKKQIPLRRTFDAPFWCRGKNTAATNPRLIIIFLKGKNPDAGVVWLNVRIVRVLKTTEGTARLDHLLVEPLNLALKQLVRI